ncbi:MAG: hypothetical protein Q6354_09275, partial [Candidatus Brocadiales bacterium]|nr:hypothetical protein [Candidatus Brocadiales bacterium]
IYSILTLLVRNPLIKFSCYYLSSSFTQLFARAWWSRWYWGAHPEPMNLWKENSSAMSPSASGVERLYHFWSRSSLGYYMAGS